MTGEAEERSDRQHPGPSPRVIPRSHLWESLQPHKDCDRIECSGTQRPGLFCRFFQPSPAVLSSEPGLYCHCLSRQGFLAGITVCRLYGGLQGWAAKVLALQEVSKVCRYQAGVQQENTTQALSLCLTMF